MKEAISPLQDHTKDAEVLAALQQLLVPEAGFAIHPPPRQQYKVMAVGGRRPAAPPQPQLPSSQQQTVPVRQPMQLQPVVVDKSVGESVEVPKEDMKQYADELFDKLRGEVKDWLAEAIQAAQPPPPPPAPVVADDPQPNLQREMLEMMQTVFLAQQKTMQGNQALLLSLIHQQQQQPVPEPVPEPPALEPAPEEPSPVKEEPVDLQPPATPLQMAASEPATEPAEECTTTALATEEIGTAASVVMKMRLISRLMIDWMSNNHNCICWFCHCRI